MALTLQKPSLEDVDKYVLALKNGYSSNNLNPAETTRRELEQLMTDPAAFVASIDGTHAAEQADEFQRKGVGRLPGFRRWLIRRGAFIGSFGLRWVPGGGELPAAVPGHVGYSVVPWERNKGYAKFGLQALLSEIEEVGLSYIDLSIDENNGASIAVAQACGARLHQTISPSKFYPDSTEHRYRISLESAAKNREAPGIYS